MRRMSGRIRAAGMWLAIASLLIIATLLLHGPISPDPSEQMRRISDHALQAGDQEVFNAWWAFAEGKATGFAFMALAVATMAGNEARSAAPTTPVWAAWAATVAGVASFSGWALGMWFGIAPGNLLWLVSSLLMSAWTLWFGVRLARSPVGAPSTAGVIRS